MKRIDGTKGKGNAFRVAGNYANEVTAIVGNFKIPSSDNKQTCVPH